MGERKTKTDEPWREEWTGMPEFVQERQREFAKIIVRFRCQEDLDDFARLIGQKLNARSQCTWHPELRRDERPKMRYVDEPKIPDLHCVEGAVGEQTYLPIP